MKAKKPKKSAEEKALVAAQARELSRQDEEINERKRRILRAQTSSRASMLSGNLSRTRQGGSAAPGGTPGVAGRSGRGRGLGGFGAVAGGVSRRRAALGLDE